MGVFDLRDVVVGEGDEEFVADAEVLVGGEVVAEQGGG